MDFHASQRRKELDKAWLRFISGNTEELSHVRPVIRDSWLRSRSYGINPDLPSAPQALFQADLQKLRDGSDILTAGDRVVRQLFDIAENSHFLVCLLDEQGRMLSLRTSSPLEEKCLEINATIGSGWGEQYVGTDAATALITGQTVRIDPGEHYCYAWKEWYSNATPIRDPLTQQIIGVLSIDWPGECVRPHIFKLLRWGKNFIEQNLRERSLSDRLYLLEQYCQHEARFPSEAILAIDRAGYITAVNPHAARIFRQPASHLMHHPISSVLGKEIEDGEEREGTWALLLPGTNLSSVQVRVLPVKRQERITGRVITLQIHKASARGSTHSQPWRAIYTFEDLIGENPHFQQALQQAKAMAITDFPLLLSGESGVGKEFLAHAIHNASLRSDGPFVPVNCGAISEDLMGAELFGYVEGAFTGAMKGGSHGKIAVAHGGTLFLDEITAMSPKMQVSLLRVLEDGVVVPVGSTQPRRVDVRVIAAINMEPLEAINQGLLRADFYYRLSGALITLPPLRKRIEDLLLLAQHILSRAGLDVALTPEAVAIFQEYPWPGNIRELRNVLLQVAHLTTEKTIRPSNLPSQFSTLIREGDPQEPDPLARAEKTSIIRTLEETGWQLSLAASRLEIHRTTLYRKMRRYCIAAIQPSK
jgi:transcriptional regulator of acetoin/glycerol metabolism